MLFTFKTDFTLRVFVLSTKNMFFHTAKTNEVYWDKNYKKSYYHFILTNDRKGDVFFLHQWIIFALLIACSKLSHTVVAVLFV